MERVLLVCYKTDAPVAMQRAEIDGRSILGLNHVNREMQLER